MTTETRHHPRFPFQAARDRPVAGWPWLRWLVVMLAFLAVCLAALYFWARASERHALRAMDPAQRGVLFENARASYRTMCGGPGVDGLALRCRSLAEFLGNFPECDAGCHAELEPSLSRASR